MDKAPTQSCCKTGRINEAMEAINSGCGQEERTYSNSLAGISCQRKVGSGTSQSEKEQVF